jgi:hypothetical protein
MVAMTMVVKEALNKTPVPKLCDIFGVLSDNSGDVSCVWHSERQDCTRKSM